MVSKQEQNELKQMLQEREDKLIKQVQDRFGTRMLATEAASELSSYDNHPADMGTSLYERGKDLALNTQAEKELEEINAALHAMAEGSYGHCSICGEDISLDRLQVVPTADTCHKHARKGDVAEDRPVEEEVIPPNFHAREQTGKSHVEYDQEDSWQSVGRYGNSDTASDFYEDKESYNEMYINSEEFIGEVEEVEGIATANIDGKNTEEH